MTSSREPSDYNPDEWVKIGEWNTSFLTDALSCEVTKETTAKEYGFQGFESILILKSNYFLSKRSYRKIEQYVQKRIKEEGVGVLHQWKHISEKYNQHLLSTARKIESTPLEDKSSEELVALFKEFMQFVKPCAAFAYFIQPFDNVLLNILKETLLSHSIPNEQITEIIPFLTPPLRPANMIQERMDLLHLAIYLKQNSSLKEIVLNNPPKESLHLLQETEFCQRIMSHAQSFGWMNNFDWIGDPFPPEHYLQIIKESLDVAEEQINDIIKKRKEMEHKYDTILKQLTEKGIIIKEFIDAIREFVNVKMEGWETVSIAGNAIRNLFTELGRRRGLTYYDVVFLFPDEIIDFNTKSDELHERAVRRRKIKGLLRHHISIRELMGDEITLALEIFSKIDTFHEIKGIVASPGKTEGRAVVLLNSTEVNKVQQGDILVCPMTDPDYMIIASKIRAIITDQGGILCHAAIVSRELNIPCIIGTEIATKVLKDGDYVEVDAHKGLVRRLS